MPKVHLYTTVAALSMAMLLLAGCPEPPAVKTPTAQFEYSPQRGPVPLTVHFNDASIPGDSAIKAWTWDFGDGGRGSGPAPRHEYRTAGTYDVALTITTAEGNFTYRRTNAVVVERSGVHEGPDPDTGTTTIAGVSITVPPALKDKVAFGIVKDAAQVPLDAFEPMTAVSDTFIIKHNLTPPDLFVYNANDQAIPTTVSIPMARRLPAPALDPAALQLLARMEDGRTVPIPGRFEDGNFVASVLRLPPRARYVVAYRSEATAADTRSIEELYEERLEADDNWADYWQLSLSMTTVRQLAALVNGDMRNEASYHRRNFTDDELVEAIATLGAAGQGLHNLLADNEMKPPTLVPEGDNQYYNVVLFNMHPQYGYDFEAVPGLIYYDNFFGHIVLDPAKLLAVTIRNLRIAASEGGTADVRQPFTATMAFSEALLQSAYPTYQLPALTTTGDTTWGLPRPADRTPDGRVKPMSFIQGLYDGAAIYFGQRQEERELPARGFGANEYALLSEPLLFPYSDIIRGYSWSGHEFFSYLDNDEDYEEPLTLVVGTLTGLDEAIDEFEAESILPLNFTQGLLGIYVVMDEIVSEVMDEVEAPANENLRDYYWMYAKDRAYVNSTTALLRPSDLLHPPYSFSAERFKERSIVHVNFDSPVDAVNLTQDTHSALRSIPPLSTRAIVFDVSPLSAELRLTFNVHRWRTDSDGYGPAVAVYKEGRPGIELSDPAGAYRDYELSDTRGDGMNDTIVVRRLAPYEEDCYSRVIVLVSNLLLTDTNSVSVQARSYGNIDTPEAEALYRYVHACDPLYSYDLNRILNFSVEEGVTGYVLDMTSGVWRNANEVNQQLWRHDLVVIEPTNVRENTALLFISGGSTDSSVNIAEARILAEFAKSTRSVVAWLRAVPNQPLHFSGEDRTRSEDALIAYSFDKYMDSHFDGVPDMSWPALFPMTRAAVRAMDAVQDFLTVRVGPARHIDNFVVAGASKRGWTTWLTAAVDTRVSAIMPMVIDVLNMQEQMEHHRKAYAGYPLFDWENRIFGGYSMAIRDYVEMEIFERFDTNQGSSLLNLVDPYRYRHLLTMPKLIVNSTGDQFFLPDSSQFYFYDMPGENYLFYAPNTDHSLTGGLMVDLSTLETMQAFYMAHVRNMNPFPSDDVVLPTYQWRRLANRERTVMDEETGEPVVVQFARLEVTADKQPLDSAVFRAYAPEHRDFRMQTLGPAWTPQPITFNYDINTGVWRTVAEALIPETGWHGFVVLMRFAGPDPLKAASHLFSTPVYVVPEDVYPTPSGSK